MGVNSSSTSTPSDGAGKASSSSEQNNDVQQIRSPSGSLRLFAIWLIIDWSGFEIFKNERGGFVLFPCSLVAGLVDCVFVHTHWTTHDVLTLHSNVSANSILLLPGGQSLLLWLGRKHFVRNDFWKGGYLMHVFMFIYILLCIFEVVASICICFYLC